MLNKNTWNRTLKKSKEEVDASTDWNFMMLYIDTCAVT